PTTSVSPKKVEDPSSSRRKPVKPPKPTSPEESTHKPSSKPTTPSTSPKKGDESISSSQKPAKPTPLEGPVYTHPSPTPSLPGAFPIIIEAAKALPHDTTSPVNPSVCSLSIPVGTPPIYADVLTESPLQKTDSGLVSRSGTSDALG